jgi:hypothetical protein
MNIKTIAAIAGGLGCLGVLVGVLLLRQQTGVPPVTNRPAATTLAISKSPSPADIAAPHLHNAERRCAAVIGEHVRALDVFFAQAKKNTPAFAEEALSFGSKWRLVADHLPFSAGGRHEAFLRRQFESHVFSKESLEQAIAQVVSSYLTQVNSIENQMLVDLRADVADLPSKHLLASHDDRQLRAEFDEALTIAMASSGSSLTADIGGQLVSFLTGEVLAQVAVRLGVSAGILGTGAASGWATFGIGVLVGVIVDQIIAWVWDWYADPKGDLAAGLNDKLSEIQRLIVSGDGKVEGLRRRLERFAAERSVARRQAVLALLKQ